MVSSVSESPPRPENAEPPYQPPQQELGCGQLAVIGGLASVMMVMALAWLGSRGYRIDEKARQRQGIRNCREIVVALQAYAKDHDGRYPDGDTANEALRLLIKSGLLHEERQFTCPQSPYIGDGRLGAGPEYADALEAGENHWAMTRGLTLSAAGTTPLIFENPAEASWPPKWNAEAPGQARPGRVWKDRTIIVGRKDGSVNLEPLVEDKGHTLTLPTIRDGKNLFDLAGPHEILDVAR